MCLRPAIIRRDRFVRQRAGASRITELLVDAVTAVQALFRTVFPTLHPLSLPKTVYASTLASRATASPLFSTSYKPSDYSAPADFLGIKRRVNITILHRVTIFSEHVRSALSSLLSDALFKALTE